MYFYKFLTILLLPLALLFGVSALLSIFIAFSNPALLLSVFLLAATSIYLFTSFQFMRKGLQLQKTLPASLFDWIKVNAYVTLVFAFMGLLQGINYYTNANVRQQILDTMKGLQQMEVSAQLLASTAQVVIGFLTVICSLLLVHVFITLSYLRKYKFLFDIPPASE